MLLLISTCRVSLGSPWYTQSALVQCFQKRVGFLYNESATHRKIACPSFNPRDSYLYATRLECIPSSTCQWLSYRRFPASPRVPGKTDFGYRCKLLQRVWWVRVDEIHIQFYFTSLILETRTSKVNHLDGTPRRIKQEHILIMRKKMVSSPSRLDDLIMSLPRASNHNGSNHAHAIRPMNPTPEKQIWNGISAKMPTKGQWWPTCVSSPSSNHGIDYPWEDHKDWCWGIRMWYKDVSGNKSDRACVHCGVYLVDPKTKMSNLVTLHSSVVLCVHSPIARYLPAHWSLPLLVCAPSYHCEWSWQPPYVQSCGQSTVQLDRKHLIPIHPRPHSDTPNDLALSIDSCLDRHRNHSCD